MPRDSKWTPEANERLFLNILEVCDITISREQWKVLADKMDGDFSAEALRCHFKKIKKTIKDAVNAEGSPAKHNAAPKSNGTKAAGAKGKVSNDGGGETPRPSSRKRAAANYDDLASDDEEKAELARKKVKHEESHKDCPADGASFFFTEELV
ncbi:hypothetical protein MPH_07346 [Macrophomina phaseolina MS6]|uniref:Myb-like domain-containing protein n=1 Tax=Macrophomina phaseolina (strain MS6) TaxID=1126212 RepID=K2SF75_MACPH|nr:hypothetical protein MPH_07346 [Macrophomina phaseolina MS6]